MGNVCWAAVLVAVHAVCIVSARELSLQSTTGPRHFTIPLAQKHGFSVERGLLRSGSLPILGAVREVGYFYTNLQVGNPIRTFSVIIDTGSTITYVPCANCKHCGKHQDPAFNPDDSKTAVKLICSSPKCDCGSPSCTCQANQCYYSRTYAERSSSEGWLVEDDFHFPDSAPAVKLVFGCENGETGEIFRQMADGIMGMGNNRNAFQSQSCAWPATEAPNKFVLTTMPTRHLAFLMQLVAQGVIDDIFGLCFGFPSGGTLLLGDAPLPTNATTVYTPLLIRPHVHYYNIELESIFVDGNPVPVDKTLYSTGYGCVLDSGTTFTYLPSAAFRAFADMVAKYAELHGLQRTGGSDPQYNDICWKGAPDQFDQLSGYFPDAYMQLGGGAKLKLTPVRYLFHLKGDTYCLGVFDNGGSGTLIGGVSVRNMLVQYDRRNSRVAFTEADCTTIGSSSLSTVPHTNKLQDPATAMPPSQVQGARVLPQGAWAVAGVLLLGLVVIGAALTVSGLSTGTSVWNTVQQLCNNVVTSKGDVDSTELQQLNTENKQSEPGT